QSVLLQFASALPNVDELNAPPLKHVFRSGLNHYWKQTRHLHSPHRIGVHSPVQKTAASPPDLPCRQAGGKTPPHNSAQGVSCCLKQYHYHGRLPASTD